MRRRDILAGAGSLAAGAASSFPAPAIAQGIRQLTMVTDWPESLPGLLPSARSAGADDRRGQRRPHQDRGVSGRRVGAPVRDLRRGIGRCRRHVSFVRRLLREEVAGVQFLFAAFLSASPRTNCSPGSATAAVRSCGTRSAANSTSSRSSAAAPARRWAAGSTTRSPRSKRFKGLRYRMPGLGAEVLRRLGAIVVTLPGGEIVPSLKSGAIDASEWIGPWLDMAIGLHKAASYYYYPGFHEPGTAQTLGINKRVWESFDAERPAAHRGCRRRRIRALAGGVQRQQRAVRCASCGTKAPSRS